MLEKSVLVVGGAGYIGSHTCKLLANRGLRPITFDNLSTGHSSFVRWGPLVQGDITDTEAVERACRDWEIDSVIHFAAHAYVGESVINPAKYYHNNVYGTLCLLDGMRRADVSKLVFSSTCAVYGEPRQVPVSESAETKPVNPYGWSKLMAERIISDYSRAYGLTWIALRYFNACGADRDGEVGELREPETHLIPRALMSILGHVADFQVFGTDYNTPDSTAVRDYIHVTDLAEAHKLALDFICSGGESGALNLGAGRGHSVKQILDRVEAITGRRLPAAQGPRRAGDPALLIADPSLAIQRLGFKPQHSDLDTILATAWAWHQRAHPDARLCVCSRGS